MSEPKLPQATLGKTGIITSILGFGTAGLGLDYGLGDDSPPSYRDGLSLLFTAWREGVRFFDTAPTYGPAEAMLGKCRLGLSDGGTLATKVSPLMRIGTPDSPLACPGSLFETAILSARISQLNLGQPVLPLVQIHSPVVEQIQDDRLARILKRDGLARRVGVSVYDFWEALTAIQTGLYDTIQVPFNLLDQRMAKEVFPAAQAAGVGIILRSALLKGALTGRGMTINPKWDKQIELIHACQRARDLLGEGS
ncbi:MAG: aldo/keto reductase, partial [Gammaproteobacteria bacterium]|nr:aldo/keto reductase [Gammaproteobacteria bacterium]